MPGGVDVKPVVDAALGVPKAVISNIFMLWFVFTLGATLVVMRWAILEMCPYGARHSKAFTNVVNGFLDVVWVIFTAIRGVIEVIIDAVRIIEGKHPNHISLDGKPAHVSNAQMEEFFRTTPSACHEYTTLAKVLVLPLRHYASAIVCPMLRYIWPVPWLYTAGHALFGWLSFDPTPIAGAPPRNCEVPHNDVDFLCVGLGSGYIVLEIVFPALILILVAGSLVEAIAVAATELAAAASRLATTTARAIVRQVAAVGAAAAGAVAKRVRRLRPKQP